MGRRAAQLPVRTRTPLLAVHLGKLNGDDHRHLTPSPWVQHHPGARSRRGGCCTDVPLRVAASLIRGFVIRSFLVQCFPVWSRSLLLLVLQPIEQGSLTGVRPWLGCMHMHEPSTPSPTTSGQACQTCVQAAREAGTVQGSWVGLMLLGQLLLLLLLLLLVQDTLLLMMMMLV